jgi:hypothetical protein
LLVSRLTGDSFIAVAGLYVQALPKSGQTRDQIPTSIFHSTTLLRNNLDKQPAFLVPSRKHPLLDEIPYIDQDTVIQIMGGRSD